MLVNSTTVVNYFLFSKVNELNELVKKELKDALNKCCLTPSNVFESFLGVTCHNVDSEFELQSTRVNVF